MSYLGKNKGSRSQIGKRVVLSMALGFSALILQETALNLTELESRAWAADGNLYYGTNLVSAGEFIEKDNLASDMSGSFNYAAIIKQVSKSVNSGNRAAANFVLTSGTNGNGQALTTKHTYYSGPGGFVSETSPVESWAEALGYQEIYVKLPDGTYKNVKDYATATGTNRYGTITLLTDIETQYWANEKYAQEIADAFSSGSLDLSKLAHMPIFYGEIAGSKELLGSTIVFNNDKSGGLQYPMLGNKVVTSNGEASYQSVNIGAGESWRPVDRLLSTQIVSGAYTMKNGLVVNPDGTVTEETIDSESRPFIIRNGTSYADWDSYSQAVAAKLVSGDITVDNGDPTINTQSTIIKVDDLSVATGGKIDLAYLNAVIDIPAMIQGEKATISNLSRKVIAENAVLSDGAVLRFGSYGTSAYPDYDRTRTFYRIGSVNDSLLITNATTPDGQAKLYYELGYVNGISLATQGVAVSGLTEQQQNILHAYPVFLGILKGAENFTVEARSSLADGVFSQYLITPVIGRYDNVFQDPDNTANLIGSAWYLDSFSWVNLYTASESGMSAVDNSVVMDNLWKSNYLNMFRRLGSLHRYQTLDDQKENVWAEAWHGKYKNASGYGRTLSQRYNALQVGYDKLLSKDFYNGKAYAGFYISKIDGNSTTHSGGGDQDSEGIGVFGSWVGNRGHYLDATLLAAKLKNDYHIMADNGISGLGRVTGSYDTWSYGLGLQYGYRQQQATNNWYWEPSAALFLGRTDSFSYSLSNALGISQKRYTNVTGKLAINVGKELGDSNIYTGLAAYHEFADRAGINAFYGNQEMELDKPEGKETWLEWNVGGSYKFSPNGIFTMDFSKTLNSDIANEWRLNGGLNWTWGGFWQAKGDKDKPKVRIAADEYNTDRNAGLVLGRTAQVENINVPQLKYSNSSSNEETLAVDKDNSSTVTEGLDESSTARVIQKQDGGGLSTFSLGALTVEAARPDWEGRLSPGQVSVVYPAEFSGEQKDLPDLLDRVPGLFVQRVSGDGHYTVARVRGSTGAQVNVYVDGVLMNLNGEAAVNLSTIPVDNVERVEVYRGYVPARFSGSPLGGVINIITKKPEELGGTITQGFKSYGGYTGTYQFSAPAGNGSILATFQRDIWSGDFPFTVQPSGYSAQDANRRSNGYQNENGMLKWQDDNWTVKAAWKDLHEQLPRAVDTLQPIPAPTGGITSNTGGYVENFHKGYYDAEQNIKQKEFQIGRRDTVGNLDWGWKVYYLNQNKDYRNTGIYKYIADTGINSEEFLNKWGHLPGFHWTKFDSDKWGINLNGSMKMGDNHLVEMNFDYSDEGLDADGSNWLNWYNAVGTKFSKNRKYLNHYKIREYHFTLQDSITLNESGDFKLTPILRADKVEMETMADNDKKWKYSGAVALQKELNEHWSIKTNWGTYNRHPNFYELFGDGATIMPNEGAADFFDLAGRGTWETGHQFDFGVNWQGKLAEIDTAVNVTWFQRRAKNQLALWQPNVVNSAGSYFPMDDARVHGIELTNSMKWGRIGFDISGTWQKSEYSDNTMGGIVNGRKSVISYTPEWVLNARLDYLFPGDKLNIFAEYHYTDKQFAGLNTEEEYDSYLDAVSTINLGGKYSFGNGWKLSAGVNDVFNKGYDARQINYGNTTYPGTRAYPLAGRMYYATVEYSF